LPSARPAARASPPEYRSRDGGAPSG
jgi:hypothetical protein